MAMGLSSDSDITSGGRGITSRQGDASKWALPGPRLAASFAFLVHRTDRKLPYFRLNMTPRGIGGRALAVKLLACGILASNSRQPIHPVHFLVQRIPRGTSSCQDDLGSNCSILVRKTGVARQQPPRGRREILPPLNARETPEWNATPIVTLYVDGWLGPGGVSTCATRLDGASQAGMMGQRGHLTNAASAATLHQTSHRRPAAGPEFPSFPIRVLTGKALERHPVANGDVAELAQSMHEMCAHDRLSGAAAAAALPLAPRRPQFPYQT